jgi:L-lactate dehydrogenase complex protein LldG
VNAREEILRRIRTASADAPARPRIPRDYRQAGIGRPYLVDLFAERVTDYRATVRRCAPGELAATIAAAVAERELRRILVPDGFPAEWLAALPPGTSAVSDDPPLSVPELDRLDGVVTTCAVAIAETGTIVLDHGPGQGRRALSLVPDYHLAVVRAEQILPGVPEAVAALDPARPMTWISGPSATSDIELSRVEGVHGPRTLEVIIVLGR